MRLAKNVSSVIKVFAIFLTLICFIGCSGSNDDNGNGNEIVTKPPVQFSIGNDDIVVTKSVGSAVDEIIIENTDTPIDGVRINFPAGALPREIEVSVGYNDGTLTPNSGLFSEKILILEVPQIKEFTQPVTITVPFVDDGTTPVPYYIDDNGSLHPTQIVSIDRDSGNFTFQIFHASFFTWLFGIETAYAPGPDDIVNTGYIPGDDGFQIVNYGSTYNRGGECFGITSFSLWYYENIKNSKGNFYPKYYDILAYDSDGKALRGQDIIATRAFISISQQWNTYIPDVAQQQTLSDSDKYASIRNIILNTGNPVLIYLYHIDDSPGAHSVLAYAFNHLDGDISLYDPNHPGTTKTIHFDSSDNSFDSYSGYDGIVYNGDGSLNLTEPYQNILDNADSNFQRSGNATINIHSHTDGQQTTDRSIQLTGTIESGEVLVTKLTVMVGSTPFSVNVGNDGSFNIPISLESGVNHLQFVTEGNVLIKEDDGSSHVELANIPNNMATVDFTIDLNVPNSIILVTLTWDTNDTDIDLYVVDPTGDYSCFYHQITADGGELDYDITTGYGPEHWTLMSTDIIRYNEPYRVRLHYYSDHGHGSSNYTVTIKVYEGKGGEQVYSYRGNMAVNDAWNVAPDDTGADWVDIGTIILTQNNSRSLNRSVSIMNSSAISEDVIFITVPVPPMEERIKQ